MKNNNYEEIIDEIHKIREALLEEGKNLTSKEYADFINKKGNFINKIINEDKAA